MIFRNLQFSSEQLEATDRELSTRGVPITLRPLETMRTLSQAKPGDKQWNQSFDEIARWYSQKYGDRATWDGIIGRQPLLIRGGLYIGAIPFTHGNRLAKISDHIEGLAPEIPSSFTEDEFKYVGFTLSEASADFNALYDLEAALLLQSEQLHLTRRAGFDLKAAALLLKENEDTQGSIVNSHQAAEKFLKTALLGFGIQQPVLKKKFSHNLAKANTELAKQHRKFSYIQPASDSLDRLLESMDMRYSELPRSIEAALLAFSAARHICAFVAEQFLMDAERGKAELDLQDGHFYRDYSGRTYRCNGVEKAPDGSRITRMMLLNYQTGGPVIDAAMRLKGECGWFYLEITEPETIASLQQRYTQLSEAGS